MRAETKPPGGFDISPEIPAALDSMATFRTLCGFASEKSGRSAQPTKVSPCVSWHEVTRREFLPVGKIPLL